MPQAKRVIVIGYGNVLRQDDGIGVAAAQRLAQDRHVKVLTCQQLMPELAETVAKVAMAVFIDASASLPAGQVTVVSLSAGARLTGDLTHYVDPPTLLAMSEQLYGRRPRAFLVSIGGQSFGLAEGLTAPVAAAMPRVLEAVRALIG